MKESVTVAVTLAELLTRDHRRLDDLFGRFLAASAAADTDRSWEASADFDEALRRHTAFEEARLYPETARKKLARPGDETEEARLFRELRLEHVQIREISGMMRRLLEENGDLAGARGLAPNLAQRWDAHTKREEMELPRLEARLDADMLAAAVQEAEERLRL